MGERPHKLIIKQANKTEFRGYQGQQQDYISAYPKHKRKFVDNSLGGAPEVFHCAIPACNCLEQGCADHRDAEQPIFPEFGIRRGKGGIEHLDARQGQASLRPVGRTRTVGLITDP